MIKEALSYLVGLGGTKQFLDANGDTWMDKPMHRIKEYLPGVSKTLDVHSLASLIEYIKGNPDIQDFPVGPAIIVIDSTALVTVASRLDEDGGRDFFMRVSCDEAQFQFGRFMEAEQFILSVHENFSQDGDGNTFQTLLSIVSAMTAQDENEIKDTGLTQMVTTRKGIDVKQEDIPNPMLLYPYRSFPEIEPVAAPFLLRVKASNNIPHVALFETDGGRWKLECRRRIKQYLVNALGDAVTEQKLTIME